MLKVVNSVLVLAVLSSAFALYSLEHAARGLEREIKQVGTSIDDAREAIKLLKAEWSSLTRPDRIQDLAQRDLGMTHILPQQIVNEADLMVLVPEHPSVKLEAQGVDPIGDILKKMQQ